MREQTTTGTWRAAWTFFSVLGVAVLLRQYLFAPSYWYDDAFLILTIRDRSYADLLGAQPYNLVVPPLFLWLTRLLVDVAGESEWVFRLLPFSAAVAALPVMKVLARSVVRPPHALWAFAWLAVSRHLLELSADVRPYTMDLLISESILLCAMLLLGSVASHRRMGVWLGLGALMALGPWISFPSVFVGAGACAALAFDLWDSNRAEWKAWLLCAAFAGLSVLTLWWMSARHLYYPGIVEHWGHRGWRGFPDWHSSAATVQWVLARPYEIGNYGTRELGIVLSALAVVGVIALFRLRRSASVLLMTPLVLAIAAALAGLYPLAERTTFFVLPNLWLLAAVGVHAVVDVGRRHGRELSAIVVLLVAWDTCWAVARVAVPDERLDYRGAYEFVRAHRLPTDLMWSQMAVVYHVYYGRDAPVLTDADFLAAKRLVQSNRVWAVFGDDRDDLRREFEAAGGRVARAHSVSGLSVLLFEPVTASR